MAKRAPVILSPVLSWNISSGTPRTSHSFRCVRPSHSGPGQQHFFMARDSDWFMHPSRKSITSEVQVPWNHRARVNGPGSPSSPDVFSQILRYINQLARIKLVDTFKIERKRIFSAFREQPRPADNVQCPEFVRAIENQRCKSLKSNMLTSGARRRAILSSSRSHNISEG